VSSQKLSVFAYAWDAEIDRQSNTMGVGLVARDHTRRVRGSRCLFQPYINDPVTAEALAGSKIWGGILQRVEFSGHSNGG
jgi:hypothetical protein